jgi:hypothetical protein
MEKRTILKLVLVGVAIPASFVMAFVGSLPFEKLGIRTPGMIASDAFVRPSPPPHEFASVGEGLRMQIIVDWIFWFAVMYALYWLFRRFGRKARNSS